MNRREFAGLSVAAVATAIGRGDTVAAAEPAPFAVLRARPVTIDMLVFERMDQIDFTGPFSVLSRLPDAGLRIVSPDGAPVRDHKGLILTPQAALSAAPEPDVLVIPGGPGQQDLMHHDALCDRIAGQVAAGRVLFSVCTGALLCGAAGVLRGRRATTHWASFELLRYFGAQAVDERVVVDGNILSAAGITAGIDGALRLAALLRGDVVAQRIQLDIQYAPEPPFNAGDPGTAPQPVLEAVRSGYRTLTEARTRTAREFAARL
jgi:cyclohexyl-isocyanide hydratase